MNIEESDLHTCMLLLLLSCFSRVRLCATPETAAQQAPSSLGFSRQEHWSGLPFPSPTHESEKWKGSRSVVSDSERPHGLQPTRLLHPWDFPGNSTGAECHCLLRTYMYEESLKNYLGKLSVGKLFAFKLLLFTDHPVMSLTSLNKALFNPKSSPNFLCNLSVTLTLWQN